MDFKPRKVLNIAMDQRLLQTPDGRVWSYSPPSYSYFEQPLETFDRVRVIARTIQIDSPPAKGRLVTGPGVELFPIPCYTGPLQYLKNRSLVIGAVSRAALLDGAFLLRIPSQTAFLLAAQLQKQNKCYAVELLTDPHDFFGPGVSPHDLAYLFRPYFCYCTRELCRKAKVANFVTGRRTFEAHPTPAALWRGNISDVDLPREAFLAPRNPGTAKPLQIINVGLLDLLYKGQDVLIRALGRCAARGMDFQLTFAGDGENRGRLLHLADTLGIGNRIQFTGLLGGAAEVRRWLQKSDLFVLPSRAEGIPRALLEAMAASLPAICSNVGAMPDLVPSKWIVPAGSEIELANKIFQFSELPEQWVDIGARNQMAALGFERSALKAQRASFYEAILKTESQQSGNYAGEFTNAA